MADPLLTLVNGGQMAQSGPGGVDPLLSMAAPSGAPDPINVNPATGNTHLQVFNPFGQNFDTGINLGDTASRTLEGVGGAMSDAWLGLKQRLGQATYQDATDKRAMDAPLQATTGGKAGNVIGNVAVAAPTAFIPGVGTYTGATLVGSGLGLLQPSTSAGETAVNTALGGAAGATGKFLGDRVASLVKSLTNGGSSGLTPGQQQALDIADQLGFKTTPANKSGNTALSQIEAKLQSQPESSGPFNAIRAQNQTTLNRVAANAIGENSDNLSSSVLGNAYDRLGNVFDSVADKTPVALDPQQYGTQIKQVLQDSSGMLNGNASLADNGLYQRLDSFINDAGGATREQLRALSSNLGKAANNNLTSQGGDRELGQSLLKLQDVVENAIQGSLSPEQQAAYATARGQYRTLMNLTARNTIVNPSSGNVNGRALANILMSKDKGGFTFGNNESDLYNAARFFQAFPSLVGDSGTPTRMPFNVGEVPSRLAGALGSRWYLGGADVLQGNAPYGVPRAMYNAATADPFAQELARLLATPAGRQALPGLAAQSALQGKASVYAPQQ